MRYRAVVYQEIVSDNYDKKGTSNVLRLTDIVRAEQGSKEEAVTDISILEGALLVKDAAKDNALLYALSHCIRVLRTLCKTANVAPPLLTVSTVSLLHRYCKVREEAVDPDDNPSQFLYDHIQVSKHSEKRLSAVLEVKKLYHSTTVPGRKDSCKSKIKTIAVSKLCVGCAKASHAKIGTPFANASPSLLHTVPASMFSPHPQESTLIGKLQPFLVPASTLFMLLRQEGGNQARSRWLASAYGELRLLTHYSLCIDDSNPVEVRDAINSMFRWYQNAVRCYVYLSDVSTIKRKADDDPSQCTWEQAFRQSKWFTQG
ncbi:uncharacterized protein BDR25DRAFT_353812 [Lindgomyces ingoldianus]|uniref:Uncharacterized protein n=1 Tax=Lindgomyces ingoldianus TaxID=673940 RepID=A0ACB6R170_9PLEO|nr:uncharacterized protein BDR25DRAFT_353812 [Lindgomyces ingoldianus]KAF2472072.1 hypothetical protein BDR25DRAFT_353812 [Lindgomyces ingoldianus]